MNIGIIGTAGRREDGAKFTKEIYNGAGKILLEFLSDYEGATLISGGAACIDFLAVTLNLKYGFKLKLHLPAEFDLNKMKFKSNTFKDSGSTINYYHEQFSKNVLKRDSMVEMAQSIQSGAEVVVTEGFLNRNSLVARDSDILIAATFSPGDKPKPGGTLDTWNKHLNLYPDRTRKHLDLNNMRLY